MREHNPRKMSDKETASLNFLKRRCDVRRRVLRPHSSLRKGKAG